MAAPNIVNVGLINGKTVQVTAGTGTGSTATAIVSNTANSGKVFKINLIQAANIDGANSADITVTLWEEAVASSGNNFDLCNVVAVPAKAVVLVTDKNSSFYLEEDRSIYCTASAGSSITVTCSYEEISEV